MTRRNIPRAARKIFTALAASLFMAALCALRYAAPAAAGDTYMIATSAELIKFRDMVNEGNAGINAVLTSDIDLSSNGAPTSWTPIGAPSYSGNFDGGGHVVSGYEVTHTVTNSNGSTHYAGFFASVGVQGVIKNLILSGDVKVEVSSDCYLRAGGIAGLLDGNTSRRGKIYNCAHTGTISAKNSGTKNLYVGGAVGYNDGIINNTFHSGDVFAGRIDGTVTSAYAGGVVGAGTKFVSNCGWNAANKTDAGYADKGVGSGTDTYNVPELDSSLSLSNIVTSMTASIDETKITQDGAPAFIRLSTRPGAPAEGAESCITEAQADENSYNKAVIGVEKEDSITFKITPLSVGATQLTLTAELCPTDFSAKAKGGDALKEKFSMTVDIKVEEKPEPRTLRVEPESAEMKIGETMTLCAIFTPEGESDAVTWASDDDLIASVDPDGLVTALSEGTAAVSASAEGLPSAQCLITVSKDKDEEPPKDEPQDDPNEPALTPDDNAGETDDGRQDDTDEPAPNPNDNTGETDGGKQDDTNDPTHNPDDNAGETDGGKQDDTDKPAPNPNDNAEIPDGEPQDNLDEQDGAHAPANSSGGGGCSSGFGAPLLVAALLLIKRIR